MSSSDISGADLTDDLQAQVRRAAANGEPLRIRGGDSKAFYGRSGAGAPLEMSAHRGIISYEPTELVLTARAGTPLAEIESLLAEQRQMLPFEPPRFAGGGTLGGAIASGLGGPRRPWCGAPRDLLLGVKLIDGRGQVMSFGGQVMKNVAGYDVSRLMAGAMGTLGVLLEVSIKVLPAPFVERTLVLEQTRDEAIDLMRAYAGRPAPLSAACHEGGRLMLRLSGNQASVDEWAARIGGETGDGGFWEDLRDHRLDFFRDPRPLWRLSLLPGAPSLPCERQVISDWGGAQRWTLSESPATQIRDQVARHDGHATVFRHGDRQGEIFHPLDPLRHRFQQGLKQAFDPKRIFNPGRIYPDL